ncbi:MAG: NMD3-related protein, partial [Thermoplasmata archaeon]
VLMEIGKVIEGSGERKRQVIKKEIVRNGVDVYIADNAYARTVCEVLKTRYHAKLSVSPRLHTRKEGKDVYRVTYLVELNRFEVDDLIYYAGEFYIVRAIEGRNVVLASERKEVVVDEEALKNVEIITLKELQEVKVVYRDKDEVTVLDENTMKLERFSGMDYPADAEKMWLLKREENIYLVPYSVVKKMGGKL